MSFDLNQFFTDIHFFFKLSSAWREDYKSLHSLTGTSDKFVIKHVDKVAVNETSSCSCF